MVVQNTKSVHKLKPRLFRSDADDMQYISVLLFCSYGAFLAGQNTAEVQAPCEPLLARAIGKTAATGSEWTKHDKQADRQRTINREREKSPTPPPVGRTGHGNPSRGGNGWWQPRVQQHSTHPPLGLVCPGCGRAGIRGGVRCNSGGGNLTTFGESKLHDRATATDTITDQICTEGARIMDATAEISAGKKRPVRDEVSASDQSSLPDVSASARCAPVGSTFHTSLGVIVDACTWWRHGHAGAAGMSDSGRTIRNENHEPTSSGGKNGQNNTFGPWCLSFFATNPAADQRHEYK